MIALIQRVSEAAVVVNEKVTGSISRGKKISGDAEDFIQDKMRSAAWLIKSIHQRQKTIRVNNHFPSVATAALRRPIRIGTKRGTRAW